MMSSKKFITSLLKKADVEINGSRDWDIEVHDERFYRHLLHSGTLGLGESYMDGWWDVKSLDTYIEQCLKANLSAELESQPFLAIYLAGYTFLGKIFNKQNIRRAFQVAEKHYDIGNELYVRMLDSNMQYSCGYWKDAKTLEEAQLAKMDLICKKVQLTKGMRVLDIGCGWGGLSDYMARNYGVDVVGITVSKEQAKLASERTKDLSVNILVGDYRLLNEGEFDRIVSVGMFEHVGYRNYREFIVQVKKLLTDDGLFLLHTIGSNYTSYTGDPWVEKYIFPNGMLPSIAQVGRSIDDLLVMEDWQNFGPDYEKTLMAWYANFRIAWPALKHSGKFDRRFYRRWKYYLLSMAGAFRSRRNNQLWQIVLSNNGVPGGYTSVR